MEAASPVTAEAKIRLHLRAVAQAPALKQNKFTIDSSQPFGEVSCLLLKKRRLEERRLAHLVLVWLQL